MGRQPAYVVARREERLLEAAREARRRRWHDDAAIAWAESDTRTRQRTAMVIAAFLLDESRIKDLRDTVLADWLLCAVPDHARDVATGVAVHALRRGDAHVWDALAAVDAFDMTQATEWYFADGVFDWSPEPEWLTPEPESTDG